MRSIYRLIGLLSMVCMGASSSWAGSGRGAAGGRLQLAVPGARGAGRVRLQLRADRLSYQPRRCAAAPCPADVELTGNVDLRGPGWRVRADRVRLRVDHQGRPRTLSGEGHLSLRMGKRRGTARRMALVVVAPTAAGAGDTDGNSAGVRLELRGAARLACPDLGLDLRGRRIAIDLGSGRLSVAGAAARLGGRSGGGDDAR